MHMSGNGQIVSTIDRDRPKVITEVIIICLIAIYKAENRISWLPGQDSNLD